ncbi:nitrate regulatory gene2 protein-like isoform X1 [Cucurbita moschata]|uniref:Nitrate regulatory gene2 protein-like isoform X1 n=2 Tax=Cucurbita moschata TaxID=3662 RepID=A0A6J1G9I1_CUCMO|nr:nitrate regulatory gene2 protein-like isoform X1 [Cucurbita moschata]
MGCSQSKIDNEEAVARCKERKIHMKEAVTTRNAFAAAHSAYSMSLKNIGAVLSDYAHGEVENPQFVYVSTQPNSAITSAPAPSEPFPPPPPLPPSNFPNSLERAATMPEMNVHKSDLKPESPIIEEEDKNENEGSVGGLRRRRSNKSKRDEGSSRNRNSELNDNLANASPQVPPPPQSENRHIPPPPQQNSTYDYFFSMDLPVSTFSEVDEVYINKEEIDIKPKVVDSDDIDEQRKSVKAETAEPLLEEPVEPPPSLPAEPATAVAKSSKKANQAGSMGSTEGKRMVKPDLNLLQIFIDIDDHFLKSCESAREVSKMLEATRLHYHSNFADNRGHIDHSARVMRVITWNRSFRGLPNMDDGKDDSYAEEQETHATVLDKLLAWEKKLYDEVKAGEVMKFEYQKKVATLNRLKKRDSNVEALEKAKAAVSHLHTRYIVDMQSLDSTVSEISRLRDEQLYPKLVQLVNGMATVWDTMRAHHEMQLKIVSALRWMDLSQSPKETSTHHYERTVQLCGVVRDWHSQFEKLVRCQKDYIKALNSWLKQNVVPIESSLKEKVSSPPRAQSPPIHKLLLAWDDQLERLPDEHLKTAIFTFGGVISTIMLQQDDERKLMLKWEETEKELERKERHFNDWHYKYQQRRTPDELDPEKSEDNTQDSVVTEKLIVVESLKRRLEEEKETHAKQCLHVREKSLLNLKNQLPELFRALSEFSFSSSEMYKNLRSVCQV